MAKKLRTTAVSFRKSVTLDLNNGRETDQQPEPPSPPPSSPRAEPEIEGAHQDTRAAEQAEKGAKVICEACSKMVSSRCFAYYHVCRGADPLTRRSSKKKTTVSEPRVEPVADAAMPKDVNSEPLRQRQ